MIIIDEQVDKELAELLEAFKLAPDHTVRCIGFNLKNKPAIEGIKEAVIASAQYHLDAANPKIFLRDDGDILIIAQPLPSKEGNQVIMDVVKHVGIPADTSWVMFDELGRQLNVLLTQVEQRLEKLRSAEDAERKLHEQKQHARKRHAILNRGAHTNATDIQQRRTQHSAPQLMMIEDDAFSTRLVENVLQKHYTLTSLNTADYAIDTYARIAPDLLFLDINLPDVTGHELLERILAIDPHAHVIMLSGNADQANIVEAMRKGAKGFIAKPFTKEKLFQYIERCPGIAQKQRSPLLS